MRRHLASLTFGAMLAALATPSLACSIIWPGYESVTAKSDVLLIVEPTSISTEEVTRGDHPPFTVRRAHGQIVRQLKGRPLLSSPTSFDFWAGVDCGLDYKVEIGRTYYVWLHQSGDQLYTGHIADAEDLRRFDRRLIANVAARRR